MGCERSYGSMSVRPDIFVDLDDVLLSFRRGAIEAHGWDLDDVERRGLAINTWQMADWFNMTQDEFWAPINAQGEAFWVNLKKNPWAEALIEMVKQFANEWYIATSPSLHPSGYLDSYIGKSKWLSNFLGPDLHRCFINPNKHKLCHPGDILIDDSPHNIAKFEVKGGRGILFPLLGNDAYEHRMDPLGYVREQLCILIPYGPTC